MAMAFVFLQFLEKLPFTSISSLLILFLGIIFFHYIFLYKTHHTTNKNKPPSPPKLPILGNLHQLGKLPHHSLRSLSQQYGDLMLLHIGSKPTIVASSADTAREIMKTHDVVFANRPKFKVAMKILYDGKDIAFSRYGEYWRQMKSICVVNVLSNTKVRSFRRVREEEAALMVENIRRFTSLEVNLSEIFANLSKDVICRTAFGRKYRGEEGCGNIRELMSDFSEALGSFCMQDFVPWLGWIDGLTGVDRKANKVAKALDEFIETIVQEHLQRCDSQTRNTIDDDTGDKVQDFVDILLGIQRENSSVLPIESIKAILMAFGMKFNGQRDGIDFKELHEKFEELLGCINVGDYIPWLGWINHVNGVEKDVNIVSRDMDRFLEKLVQEHKSRGINQEAKSENTHDFLDVLLDLQQDHTAGMSLDKDNIKGIILNMFLAGSTTTFATLEWAISELLRNPTVMETLKKEVRGITRGKANITENDIEKMEYLKAVIKETFRLHPPAPLLLPRISSQETQFNGYNIPAKTQVIINAFAIHRDPTFWKEPEQFNPERFLNSPIDFKGQHFNLIPFGSGRRGCPGIYFGTANIEFVLANIVQKFDWVLPEGAQGKNLDMEEHPGLTTHRETPLIAIATPHST